MRAWRKTSRHGFTLMETVLAGIILCGAVLATGAISTRSLRAAKLNREYEQAAQLADRQLTVIDYIGVDNFIDAGITEGVFDGIEHEYRWEMSAQYDDIHNLHLVTVTVSWAAGGHNHSVCVETMLEGIGASEGVISE